MERGKKRKIMPVPQSQLYQKVAQQPGANVCSPASPVRPNLSLSLSLSLWPLPASDTQTAKCTQKQMISVYLINVKSSKSYLYLHLRTNTHTHTLLLLSIKASVQVWNYPAGEQAWLVGWATTQAHMQVPVHPQFMHSLIFFEEASHQPRIMIIQDRERSAACHQYNPSPSLTRSLSF